MCKFSIITVCLNAAATIEQTINSVLAQSYPPFEYIVVDGGSTDGTREIIERYRSHFAHVIFEPDDGIYDAFNKGIRLASGDIIGILNADDLYAPWALEKVAESYRRNPHAGVLYGDSAIIDEKKHSWSLYCGNHEKLNMSMSIPHPSTFIVHDVYKRRGLFDARFKIAGDWDFILRLCNMGENFIRIPSPLTAFRNTGISSTQNYDKEKLRICRKYHLSFLKIVAIPWVKQQIRKFLVALFGEGWLRWRKKRWLKKHPEMRPREFNGDFEELWQQIDGEHKSGLEMSGNQ